MNAFPARAGVSRGLRILMALAAVLGLMSPFPMVVAAGSPRNELRVIVPEGSNALHLGSTLTIRAAGKPAQQVLGEVADVAHRNLTLYLNEIKIPGLQHSYKVVPNADAKEALRKAIENVSAKKTALTQAELNGANSPSALAAAQKALATAQEEETDARDKLHDPPNDVDLCFVVERKPEIDASRQAWDALLRPLNGYENDLSVALAVGSSNPMQVEGPGGAEKVKFEAGTRLKGGLVVGIFVAVVCGAILLLQPNMLRENGDPELAYSLGRTQMAFWGIVVLSCFSGVAMALGTLEYIPAQVLVLLGISATTALSARMINSGNPATPKSKRAGIKGFFEDICVGDQGASFHRVQVVLWTVVLGVYFVWNVLQMISMPVFPDTLLVLMAISNGTYLGFKTQEGKLDIAPPEIRDGKVHTTILGGTGPFEWTLECEPADMMTLTHKTGTHNETAGALAIPVSAVTKDGKVKLTVKDRTQASVTRPLELKKLAVVLPVITKGRLQTTITDGAKPYKWTLACEPETAMTLTPEQKSGTQTEAGAPPISLTTARADGKLTLKVQDQTGTEISMDRGFTKLELAPLEIKNGILKAAITKGEKPYEWTLACEPATAMTLTQEQMSGIRTEAGEWTIQVSAASADGTLMLKVQDQIGTATDVNIPVSKG